MTSSRSSAISATSLVILGVLISFSAGVAHGSLPDGPGVSVSAPTADSVPSAAAASTINVTGQSGKVSRVRVTLNNLNADFDVAVNVLLVGPTGARLVLLGDAGGFQLVSNATLRFEDAANDSVGTSLNGNFKPTVTRFLDSGERGFVFPPVLGRLTDPSQIAGPQGFGTLASVFNGTDPNGDWKLYLTHDIPNPGGSVSIGSWSLDISTDTPTITTVTGGPNPAVAGTSLTFTATVTRSGSPVTQGSVLFVAGTQTQAVSVNGSGQSSFTTSSLPEGTHAVTAVFTSGSGLPTSTGTYSQVVTSGTPTTPSGTQFCNPRNIAIPQSDMNGSTFGDPSTPYPSTINVSGLTGAIGRVSVLLNGVTHAAQSDVRMMLVHPNGTSALEFWSKSGNLVQSSVSAISGLNLVFSDTAAAPLSQSAALTSGTYLPTVYNLGTGIDPFPAPAPQTFSFARPYGASSLTTTFGGLDPNGTWQLYVVDGAMGGSGNITNGWCLDIQSTPGSSATTTALTASANPSATGDAVTFTATVTSGGSPVTSGTVFIADEQNKYTATAPLNGAGQAVFTTPGLTEGPHTITATYSPVPPYGHSVAQLTHQVDTTRTWAHTAGTAIYKYCNPGLITIPGMGARGPAAPYPSRITVADLPGTVNTLGVELNNFTHWYPADLSSLLVGPYGGLDFFSHLGANGPIRSPFSGGSLTLADSGGSYVTGTGNGTFRPTSVGAPHTFPLPAPAGPYSYAAPAGAGTLAAISQNQIGNGIWSLYMVADENGAAGTVGNWCLKFTQNPPDLTITKTVVGSLAQGQQPGTFKITVTNSIAGRPAGGTIEPVTVTVGALPAGLTKTGLSGSGWSCNLVNLTCTRNDMLAGGSSYPDIFLTVDVASDALALVTTTATVSGGGDISIPNNTVSPVTPVTQFADLTVSLSHTGTFKQGDTGRSYTITVNNTRFATTTADIVVTPTLGTGLTATSISGTNWTCTLSPLRCTRSTPLPLGGSSSITLLVDVASDAPASVTPSVTVSGGGEIIQNNDTATDFTAIAQRPQYSINVSHTGNFAQGQNGASYTIAVNNIGAGPTEGTVTMTASLPSGMTATNLAGAGWSCVTGTLTCTTTSVLPGGASYASITLTLNVGELAPDGTASATVSGGGALAPATDTDLTTVIPKVDITVTAAGSLAYTVDGTPYTGTNSFRWLQGTNHTLGTSSPQAGATGVQYVFSGWSNGGAMSQTVAGPGTPTTYTATFGTEYRLTTAASPSAGGTATPVSGNFYAANTVVPVQASPNAGYFFGAWTGAVASTSNASTTVTMTAPQTVTAGFTAIVPVSITTPPANLTVNNGQQASFTAAASGVPAPTVQWQVSTDGGSNYTNLAGEVATTLTFTSAAAQTGNRYRAVFTNLGGSLPSSPATLTVNPVHWPVSTANDSGAGSLRQAIADALPGDVVDVAPTGTIALAGTPLSITKNLTVTGPGARQLTISGEGLSRVLEVSASTVTVSGLTLANGLSTAGGGGVLVSGGTLNLDHCAVSNNSAVSGGGIAIDNGGTATLDSCTVSGNTASATGGGIENAGTLTLKDSTVAGNSAVAGGGILNNGTAALAGATVSASVRGGGIRNQGTLTAASSIIAGNSGADCETCGSLGTTNLIGVPPRLNPLQDNGGPTFTMLPMPDSPALLAGAVTASADPDQRGVARPLGVQADAGAVQTKYALSFAQQPANASYGTVLSPAVKVQVTENGQSLQVPVTLSFSDARTLGGTTTRTTAAADNTGTFDDITVSYLGTQSVVAAINSVTKLTSSAFLISPIPPAVTTDPANQTVCENGNATFTAAASGGPAPTVQWQVSTNGGSSFTNVPGATSNTLTFAATASQHLNQYRAVFTNAASQATSAAAVLTVNLAPTVTTNPAPVSVIHGQTVTLTAAATGRPTPTVQWQSSTDGTNWSPVAGATSTTLTFSAVYSATPTRYRAVFTNSCGSVNTSSAMVTVTGILPSVTTHPVNQTACAGATVTFTAAGTGEPLPTVQWQVSTNGGASFANIPGATALSLPVTASVNGARYRAVFTNGLGSIESNQAILTVNTVPVPASHPSPLTVNNGATATFIATATGNPAPTVQWQVSTDSGATFQNIPGATSGTLSFQSALSQSGNRYRAVFTTPCAVVESNPATLTVNPVTFTVSSAADAGAGSLRQALLDSHSGDTINITTTGTIALASGGFVIDKNLTINGPGAKQLTISGATQYRVFEIAAGVTASISGLTVTNGKSPASTSGGGILVSGTLTLQRANISNNSAATGGGIRVNGGGSLAMTDCTVAYGAANSAGGIDNAGTLSMVRSTVARNNNAGITNAGTLTLAYSSVSQNILLGIANSGTLTATASIVAGNLGGADCVDCGTQNALNFIGGDPMLGPLQDNGGDTATMLPLPSSPVLRAGELLGSPLQDQRGVARAGGLNADLGAVQTNYAIGFVQQPGNSIFSAVMTPAATVQVTENNQLLTVPVTVALQSGGTVLGTTTQNTTGAQNTAAFGNLAIGVVGAQRLVASINAFTQATSNSFTVGQATPVITWAAPAAIAYETLLSATQLNATADVPGTFTYTPAAGAQLAAGNQTLSVAFAPTDTTNYTAATATVTLVVNKATPVITWAPPAAISYGAALSATQLNATTTVAGTFTYTPAAGAVLAAGSRTLSVTFTPADTANYTAATASVTLVVNKTTPVITWPTPAAIGYETLLSATQLNATTTVPGTFVYTPPAGTKLTAGDQTLSVTFTPTDTANYTNETATVNLTVNKTTPPITWPAPAAITYGTALSATQLNATSTVPGTFTYNPAAGAVLTAGTQTLSVTFAPADAANYTSATSTVQLTVNQATPVITWAAPAAITYETLLSAAQLNATADVPGTFTYTPALGAKLSAGTQTLSVAFAPTDAANYTAASATVTLVVNKATPVITWAAPAAITYGAALSATQLNATTTVAGTFAYTPAAGAVLGAGSRSLSVTFTPADTANYTTATASVTLVVNKATPVITWPTPAAISYETLLSATQLNATTTVPGTFVYTPPAGTKLTAGDQTLSVTFTPADTANYTNETATVNLTVNRTTPPITWPAPAAITYGTALSATQLNATSTVPGTFTYNPAAGAVLTAGSQTLSVTFAPADAANYTNATSTVLLTVNKATPAITWAAPAAITYETLLSAAQLNATASVPGAFTYTPALGAKLSAGTQTLSVAFAPTDATNYTAASATVTLVVNKATPVITWAAPAAITYGAAVGATQLNATANVPGTLTYDPPAGTVPAAGSRTLSVTFAPADPANYTAAAASVSLVVNKATPVVTWSNPAPITYGTPLGNAELSATANVPGSFAYTPGSGERLAAGTRTLSVTFTPYDAANYTGASASVTLTVNTATPAITWTTPTAITYGTALGAAQLSAQSSVPGTFTYTPPAGTVLPAGSRTLTVNFTPSDPLNYTGATGSVTLVVNKGTSRIAWATPSPILYGAALGPQQLNATADGLGTFSYSPAAGTVLEAGSRVLTVTFTPSDPENRNQATATVTLQVRKATQTIAFAPISDRGLAEGPFTVGATASSGLPVQFRVVSGPATISGSTVSVTAIGAVTIRASQAGNANFEPAPDVDQSFGVSKVRQAIDFGHLPERTVGDAPFTVTAAASSGLPVVFSVTGPAAIEGSTITVTGTGFVAVTASQPGDAVYAPAVSVTQAFFVKPAAQPAAPVFILDPVASAYSADGGTGTIALTAVPVTAPWSAVSNHSWIHVTSGTEGPGNGTILYTVDANPAGSPRQGTITIAGLTFTVQQASAAACIFTLNPNSLSLASDASSGDISVQASAASCAWTAATDTSWITMAAGASGKGSGSVRIAVASNPGPNARSGSLTIGGQTLTIAQEGPCAVSLGSTEANLPASGGNGFVTISAARAGGGACNYGVTDPPSWITVTEGGSGSGSGILAFVVAPNSSAQPRSARLSISGQAFAVNQQGATCTVSLTSDNSVFGASGGAGSIGIRTNDESCSWSAASNAGWLNLTSATEGKGSGTLSYTVAANTVPTSRGAAVTIAGQSVRMQQDGAACEYRLRSDSGSVQAGGGRATVGIVAASACTWTASTGSDWLSLPIAASGSGTADVVYEAAPNPSAEPRTGSLTIAGKSFSVTQPGASCEYRLASTSARLSADGGNGSFDYTSSASGCTAEATSANSWISVRDRSSGTVSFRVDSYTGAVARSGVITLANQTFQITQDPPACSFTLLDRSVTFSREGGQGSLRFRVSGGSGCTPTINASSGLTLGSITGGSSGEFALPYTVPAFATFNSNVRLFTIELSGQVFKIKQRSW